MNIDAEAVRRYYEQLSDEEIGRLANFESGELTADAVLVLREEIRRRGLSDDFNAAIDIHVKGVTENEVRELVDKISRFPCPVCGQRKAPLNAFNVWGAYLKSFPLVYPDKHLIIACPDCIISSAKDCLATALTWGWWTMWWGPLFVIGALFVNVKALRARTHLGPTHEFVSFVRWNAAPIAARMHKINSLRDLAKILDENLLRVGLVPK